MNRTEKIVRFFLIVVLMVSSYVAMTSDISLWSKIWLIWIFWFLRGVE